MVDRPRRTAGKYRRGRGIEQRTDATDPLHASQLPSDGAIAACSFDVSRQSIASHDGRNRDLSPPSCTVETPRALAPAGGGFSPEALTNNPFFDESLSLRTPEPGDIDRRYPLTESVPASFSDRTLTPRMSDQHIELDAPASPATVVPLFQHRRRSSLEEWHIENPTTYERIRLKRFGKSIAAPLYALQRERIVYLTDNVQKFVAYYLKKYKQQLDNTSLSRMWHSGRPYGEWRRPDLDSLDLPEGCELGTPKDAVLPRQFTSANGVHYTLFTPLRQFKDRDGRVCATTSRSRLKKSFPDAEWEELKGDQRVPNDQHFLEDKGPLYALQYDETVHLTDNITAFARIQQERLSYSALTRVWNYYTGIPYKGWSRPDLQSVIDAEKVELVSPKDHKHPSQFFLNGRDYEVFNATFRQFLNVADGRVYATTSLKRLEERLKLTSKILSVEWDTGWTELKGGQRVPSHQVYLHVLDQCFYAFQYHGKDILTDNTTAFSARRGFSPQTMQHIWYYGGSYRGWSRSDSLETLKEDGVELAPLPRQEEPTAGVSDIPILDVDEPLNVSTPEPNDIAERPPLPGGVHVASSARRVSTPEISSFHSNQRMELDEQVSLANNPFFGEFLSMRTPEPGDIDGRYPLTESLPASFSDQTLTPRMYYDQNMELDEPASPATAVPDVQHRRRSSFEEWHIDNPTTYERIWLKRFGKSIAAPLYALQRKRIVYLTDDMRGFITYYYRKNRQKLDNTSLSRMWHSGQPYGEWRRPDLDSLDLPVGCELIIPKDAAPPRQFTSANGVHYTLFTPLRQFKDRDGRVCATTSRSRLKKSFPDAEWEELKGDQRVPNDQLFLEDKGPLYALQYDETVHLTDNITAFARIQRGRLSYISLTHVWNYYAGIPYKRWSRPDLQSIIDAEKVELVSPKDHKHLDQFSLNGRDNEVSNATFRRASRPRISSSLSSQRMERDEPASPASAVPYGHEDPGSGGTQPHLDDLSGPCDPDGIFSDAQFHPQGVLSGDPENMEWDEPASPASAVPNSRDMRRPSFEEWDADNPTTYERIRLKRFYTSIAAPLYALQYERTVYLTDDVKKFPEYYAEKYNQQVSESTLLRVWHYGQSYKGWRRPDLDSLVLREGCKLATPRDGVSPRQFTSRNGVKYTLFNQLRQFRDQNGCVAATMSLSRLKELSLPDSEWMELEGDERVPDDRVNFEDKGPLYALQHGGTVHLTDNIAAFAHMQEGNINDDALRQIWKYYSGVPYKGWSRPDLRFVIDAEKVALVPPKDHHHPLQFSVNGKDYEVFNTTFRQFRNAADNCVYATTSPEGLEERLKLAPSTLSSRDTGWKELKGRQRVPSGQVVLHVIDQQRFYAFQYHGKDILTDNLVAFNARRGFPAQTIRRIWYYGQTYQGWSRSDNLESLAEYGVKPAPRGWQKKHTARVSDQGQSRSDNPEEYEVRPAPKRRQGECTARVSDVSSSGFDTIQKICFHESAPCYALQYKRTVYLTDDMKSFVKYWLQEHQQKLDQSSLAKVWNYGQLYKDWRRPDLDSLDLPEGRELGTPRDAVPPRQFISRNGVKYTLFTPLRQFRNENGFVCATTSLPRLRELSLPGSGWKELKGDQCVPDHQVNLEDKGLLYALQYAGTIHLTDNITAFVRIQKERIDDSSLTQVWNYYIGVPYKGWSRPDLRSVINKEKVELVTPKDHKHPSQFSLNGRDYEVFNDTFRQFRDAVDGRVYATTSLKRLEERLKLAPSTLSSDHSRWEELKGGQRVPSHQVVLYVLDQQHFYAFQYHGKDILTDSLIAFNARRGFPVQTMQRIWYSGGEYRGWKRSNNLEFLEKDGVELAPLPRQGEPTAGVFDVDPAFATTYIPFDYTHTEGI